MSAKFWNEFLRKNLDKHYCEYSGLSFMRNSKLTSFDRLTDSELPASLWSCDRSTAPPSLPCPHAVSRPLTRAAILPLESFTFFTPALSHMDTRNKSCRTNMRTQQGKFPVPCVILPHTPSSPPFHSTMPFSKCPFLSLRVPILTSRLRLRFNGRYKGLLDARSRVLDFCLASSGEWWRTWHHEYARSRPGRNSAVW